MSYPVIAILGAGSIGCYLGARLLHAGIDTVLIGRERLQAVIRQHGLSFSDWRGNQGQTAAAQVRYETAAEALADADIVLVTVKGGATAEAAELIRTHAKPAAVVANFQNGIRNGDILKQALPEFTVLTGMVPFNVVNQGDGQFHCATEGDLVLQAVPGKTDTLVEALARAGLQPHTHADMQPILWGKLMMNLNNSINALSGVPIYSQLQQRGYRRALAASMDESLSVLKRAGIRPARTGKVIPALLPSILRLPNWAFTRVANAMLKIDPTAVSSMSDDLAQGRTTEIDFLNGEIADLGADVGVATPINQAIVALIKTAEQQAQGSPQLSADALCQKLGV